MWIINIKSFNGMKIGCIFLLILIVQTWFNALYLWFSSLTIRIILILYTLDLPVCAWKVWNLGKLEFGVAIVVSSRAPIKIECAQSNN